MGNSIYKAWEEDKRSGYDKYIRETYYRPAEPLAQESVEVSNKTVEYTISVPRGTNTVLHVRVLDSSKTTLETLTMYTPDGGETIRGRHYKVGEDPWSFTDVPIKDLSEVCGNDGFISPKKILEIATPLFE